MNSSVSAAADYVISVAIPRPLEGLFTYRISEAQREKVKIGGWVKVPFGRTMTHAFIVEEPRLIENMQADFDPAKLKNVIEVGDEGAIFTDDVMATCKWAADYYFSPLGEVLHCAAPPAALGFKSVKQAPRTLTLKNEKSFSHSLTEEQLAALAILEEVRKKPRDSKNLKVALLQGVTGSGKTELYIELAKRTLAEGKGVLILVPEIALSSQLHERFETGLGVTVALWHSALADGKRRDQGAALRKGEINVVVGARSAVFAPVQNLGLIVIDEEHDPTYKQEDRVRYHARDLAVVRSKYVDCMVLLGSATPSMETQARVSEGRYAIAHLKNRVASGGLPTIEIVNLCEEIRVEAQAPLAKKTLDAIQQTLDAGEQVIVFLNRRGFASFLTCEDCGDTPGCPNCSISLTVHKKPTQLKCHVCAHIEPVPDFCRKCQGTNLKALGAGTESLEAELPTLLTGARALRLDRDIVTSNTRLDKVLEEFRSGKANLLLGTQMLVKGHDFPGVTLVVVILADALFRWPDFRAPERAFQVLKQVSGRAGRREKLGKVLIQTFDPEHPVLQTVTGVLPESIFLETEREIRQTLNYPPFGRLARLRFESRDQSEARAHAQQVAQYIKRPEAEAGLEILGPSEAFLEKAKGIFRWDLLIKARDIRFLQRAIYAAKEISVKNKWALTVDIDPNGVS